MIGENFPYTNFHDMNLDWMIKIAKDFLDQYTSIQTMISEGETSLEGLTTDGLQQLQDKADALEEALQAWYTEHSEDIAGDLADALEDISDALTAAISSFNTAADAKAVETLASIPADYTDLSNLALLLQYYIFNSYTGKGSEFTIPAVMYSNTDKILDQYGSVISLEGWNTTDLIELPTYDMYFGGNNFPAATYNTLCLYDENQTLVTTLKGTNKMWLHSFPTAKYFRASKDNADNYYTTIKFSRNLKGDNMLNRLYTSNEPIKIPDDFYVYTGLLSSNATSIEANSGFRTTDYLPIFAYDIIFAGNHFPAVSYNTFAIYDDSLTVLDVIHGPDNAIAVADYPTARYFRCSKSTDNTYYTTVSNKMQTVYHVGSGQEFTTLRAGIARAIKIPNATVIVHPGTYDLTSEFAAEIAAASSTGNVGIVLQNDVTVIFMPGAKVTALFPSSSDWINIHFSPFLTGSSGFTIIGLDIEASNCRYCLHDELSGADVQYRNIIKNCIMKMTYDSASGASTPIMQCIGGGLGKHGYIEITGGKYTSVSNVTGENPTISYHNSATANSWSQIFIDNVYVSNCFRFGYHGVSTDKTPVMVSNCSMASAIIERAEELSDLVDNFDVTEWNNTIR